MSKEILVKTLEGIGIEPSATLLNKFEAYFKLLVSWNQKMNLTSITDEEGVYEKHFADSLIPAKSLSFENKKVLDIGSGGGFPGLVIALAFPSSEVTVLDATAKKFIFLKEVAKELGLSNVKFVNARIEDRKVPEESFDIVISRGFAALPIFLECAAPFTKVGGYVLAMKGASYQSEIEASKKAKALGLELKKTDVAELPNAGVRASVVYLKNGHTPKKYPRRWDEMKREYR